MKKLILALGLLLCSCQQPQIHYWPCEQQIQSKVRQRHDKNMAKTRQRHDKNMAKTRQRHDKNMAKSKRNTTMFFISCFAGPDNNIFEPPWGFKCLELFDFDCDGDVDLEEYAYYQNHYEDWWD